MNKPEGFKTYFDARPVDGEEYIIISNYRGCKCTAIFNEDCTLWETEFGGSIPAEEVDYFTPIKSSMSRI